jgi:hypothetical protein
VVASQEVIDGVKGKWRKTVGVEMEGFAIFQAALEADVPKPIPILIKSVCDFGDELKDDTHQRLAAHTSAEFFVRFAIQHLAERGESSVQASTDVHVVALSQQKLRDAHVLEEKLDRLRSGASVKFISITGKSILVPTTSIGGDPLGRAVERGVKVYGILLEPTSAEADMRSRLESPGIGQKRSRLLIADAHLVSDHLERKRSAPWRQNVELRYSNTGLSFKLWLFDECALVEPYHFGKLRVDQSRRESPLCGFSHLWIKPEALEYEILEHHFDQLWRKCERRWPPVNPRAGHQ